MVTEQGAQLHNGAETAGADLAFVTDGRQWSYAVSVPVAIPPPRDATLQPVIVVDIHVLEGRVGVGMVDDTLQQFVSPEADADASDEPVSIEMRPRHAGGRAHVMVRNTASDGIRSRFRVRVVRLRWAVADRRLLVPHPVPNIPVEVHGKPPLTGTFDVLISHSSRRWMADHCGREYLRTRYARTGRLAGLPPFESLPPNTAPYHGLLSVFRLQLSSAGVTSQVLQHYTSAQKIVHAGTVGNEVVVCFDAGLAVFARRVDRSWLDVIPESAEPIIDPWFGGLHTVVPADHRTCLVSSSGADAILWVDLPRRQVVRRWRLPESRYGINYRLDETTWLNDHYVSNDLQLGHLNCAASDGRGGAFFSVLGQGDVGHVSESGASEILATGYVGCHGVRYTERDELLYFSDTCAGRLMRLEGRDRATVLFDAGSRWLHDAVHLADGLFLLTLGDRNRLALADVERGRMIAEWDFNAADGNVQFLSVTARHGTGTR